MGHAWLSAIAAKLAAAIAAEVAAAIAEATAACSSATAPGSDSLEGKPLRSLQDGVRPVPIHADSLDSETALGGQGSRRTIHSSGIARARSVVDPAGLAYSGLFPSRRRPRCAARLRQPGKWPGLFTATLAMGQSCRRRSTSERNFSYSFGSTP